MILHNLDSDAASLAIPCSHRAGQNFGSLKSLLCLVRREQQHPALGTLQVDAFHLDPPVCEVKCNLAIFCIHAFT
jgi:hypothetical protein